MSNLQNVNNLLFAQLERLSGEKFTIEEMEREVKRSESMVKISNQIIDAAQTQLSAVKVVAEFGDKFAGHLPMIGKD